MGETPDRRFIFEGSVLIELLNGGDRRCMPAGWISPP
jgi:hypothetical protein